MVDPRATNTGTGSQYSEPAGSVAQFATGLIFLIIAFALILADGLLSVISGFGVAFAIVALYLLPPVRRRLQQRHPPTTFGPTVSVDERYVDNTDRPCTVCGSRVEDGIVRDYNQEYVVAGLPLYTMEDGDNYYCQECRNVDSGYKMRAADGFEESEDDIEVDESLLDEEHDEIDRELERIQQPDDDS